MRHTADGMGRQYHQEWLHDQESMKSSALSSQLSGRSFERPMLLKLCWIEWVLKFGKRGRACARLS